MIKIFKLNACAFPFLFRLVLAHLLFCLPLASNAESTAKPASRLVILNWSEYLSPEIVDAFENRYNTRIREVYFESDDDRDRLLLQTGGEGYDLILINGASFNSYVKRGYLSPLDQSKLKYNKHIESRWRDAFTFSRDYGYPYFWGTLGIAYRKDLVEQPITSWMQFFQPAKDLQGKILVVKSSRDVIGMALKALGYSANSENPDEIKAAGKLLMSQKEHVAKYGYISLAEESSLVSGDIVAATVFGGDALNVSEHSENIQYVIPKEGGNIWVDYFTLSSKSQNQQLAYDFINFINQPEIAAKNAEEMYLATPNSAAKKLLSKQILNDPVIYPDKTLLQKSEFYTELSSKTNRLRSGIYARLMQ